MNISTFEQIKRIGENGIMLDAIISVGYRVKLGRVRSIRASERRIYKKITDIFAECGSDFDRLIKQLQNNKE